MNEKSTVKTGVKIVVPNIEEVVGIGDIVEISNTYRSELDGAYQIKSLKAFYPQYKTEVVAGEHIHDQLEREKDVTAAIHNLEDFDFVQHLLKGVPYNQIEIDINYATAHITV